MLFWRRKKTIRATEFILVDGDGKERAALRTDQADNALIHFTDDTGRVRLSMGITPEGTPKVILRYAEGKGAIELEANDRLRSAGMIIRGSKGRIQVLFGLAADGTPLLAFLDETGQVVHTCPSPQDLQSSDTGSSDGFSFDWDSLLRY